MTIFDFLVLKIENFGFETPYQHVLGEFGEFWKNPYFWAPSDRGGGGGAVFVDERNFGKQKFFGTCNFFEDANFQKKNFFGQSLDDLLSAKLMWKFSTAYFLRNDLREKNICQNIAVFLTNSPNVP